MRKPVSLQLYSVREQAAKDFPAALRRLASMGYGVVEFAGLHGKSAKEIAGLLKELGQQSPSWHAAMPTKENIGALLDDAKTLGVRYHVAGFGPNDMKTLDGVKACADKFAAGAELLKGTGIALAMHNHWWEFSQSFDGKTAFEIIMSAVPALKSELDIYWVTKGGADAVEVWRTWESRIPLLHVKDGDLSDANVFCAVGDGKVPVAQILTAAANSKAVEYLVVELDSCQTDMMVAVQKSLGWLVTNGFGDKKK